MLTIAFGFNVQTIRAFQHPIRVHEIKFMLFQIGLPLAFLPSVSSIHEIIVDALIVLVKGCA
ncbi:hypothetical protein A1507_08320 [Methylomonas koyamae]|uniref:Uncharacterized protein n=1 Tax=Methylomonas koyamae TaxID=702114 RepID=A0A177NPC9_9GAMM|nr:hypothetical protein A1507_08320 [Methylomonas koyamae]